MGLIRGKPILIISSVVLALTIMTIPLPSASAPLVADHTVVEKYKEIPPYWINEIKKMWLNVPGESHSSGYRKGLELLETIDSGFQVNSSEDGSNPEAYIDTHLRVSGHRRNNSGWWSYGAGEEN